MDTAPFSLAAEPAVNWRLLSGDEVLDRLGSRVEGLADDEARHRLVQHGPNQLVIAEPTPWWRILAAQFRGLVVLLLVGAALVALFMGDALESAAIGLVLVVNALLGFWTELRAVQAMEALRRLGVQEATVLRDGAPRTIDARELVPGDVIALEAGDAVPADARVLRSSEMRVNQAPLTGESVPLLKGSEPEREDDHRTPLEASDLVFKGTLVVAGSGLAVVTATGLATQIGRVTELVQEADEGDTPLERRLNELGGRLVWVTLGIAAVVAALGAMRGQDLALMIETGLALAIAAVPEGLPVVATITLAVGMRRMARRNALLRRLPAVETLGSATVVCADKTGTLTAGEMTVTEYRIGGATWLVEGSGYEPVGAFRRDGHTGAPRPDGPPGAAPDGIGELLAPVRAGAPGTGAAKPADAASDPGLRLALEIGALANRARLERDEEGTWVVDGDPTDGALLVAARKGELEREALLEAMPEVGDVPFSSQRMFMATAHQSGEETVLQVKGAPHRILERSSHVWRPDGPAALDAEGRAALEGANLAMAERGLRVLALATRRLPSGATVDVEAVRELTFVALVGMQDPPAPGVADTIRSLRTAGIRSVMITGDQEATARAVAERLGLLEGAGETLEGWELARSSSDELVDRVAGVSAYSRVSPEDKLRIVRALQRRGEIVGMLGDGVNDAPALKRADVGVAMGRRGTDVAKETADLVLLDDRFSTVAAAVEEGRVIFDNIRKFIFFLFSCNLSELMVLLGAGIAGLPLPLLPLQILWLNLVTDVFPALALAMEPAEPDVMRRPPRAPDAAILSRSFATGIVGYGSLLTAATLGVFVVGLHGFEADGARAVTLGFMTLALTQLLHVFNARSPTAVVFSRRVFRNGWVWGAVGLTLALQGAAVYVPPLARVLGTHPLGAGDWVLVLSGAVLPLLVGQVWKVVRGRRLA